MYIYVRKGVQSWFKEPTWPQWVAHRLFEIDRHANGRQFMTPIKAHQIPEPPRRRVGNPHHSHFNGVGESIIKFGNRSVVKAQRTK